jgi:hypothetical protein
MLRDRQIEPVLVQDDHLHLLPLRIAGGADLPLDLLAELPTQGFIWEHRIFLTTALTTKGHKTTLFNLKFEI